MQTPPNFLRHTVVYGFGTLVVNACGFFLLPLYLRLTCRPTSTARWTDCGRSAKSS